MRVARGDTLLQVRKGPARAFSSFRHVKDHHEASAASLLHIEVGGVVWDVAVHEPFSWPARLPDDVISLAWPHIDRVSFESRGGG
jgi:hypothetical protein